MSDYRKARTLFIRLLVVAALSIWRSVSRYVNTGNTKAAHRQHII